MESRSARLRKIAIVYEECLKKMPLKKTRSRRVKILDKSPKPLNSYQIFVRDESRKSKYVGVSAQERMTEMAKEWKKTKDKK
jgi:hypothetical protein